MPVDVFEKENLAVIVGYRCAIKDQHGNLVGQIYLFLLLCLKSIIHPLPCPPWIISEHPRSQRSRILNSNAAVAEIAPALTEGRLGRGRMQVDVVGIGKGKLDQA